MDPVNLFSNTKQSQVVSYKEMNFWGDGKPTGGCSSLRIDNYNYVSEDESVKMIMSMNVYSYEEIRNED